MQLIPVLSKEFGDHTIIVRPHPSENHEPWVEISEDLPNVKVLYEGSINEWALAADVVIFNNCTTGVEAFLLERPVISYRRFKMKQLSLSWQIKSVFRLPAKRKF